MINSEFNIPSLAIEVPPVVKESGLDSVLEKWYSYPMELEDVPLVYPPPKKLPEVDAEKIIEKLSASRELCIYALDFCLGCGKGCHTCAYDAPPLIKRFSIESIKSLFENSLYGVLEDHKYARFDGLKPPGELRIGYAGDLFDHPQSMEILRLLFEKFKKFEILVNFRPQQRALFDELLELMRGQKNKHVIISLPYNRSSAVNQIFEKYAAERQDVFKKEGGNWISNIPGIRVYDVSKIPDSEREPRGRMLKAKDGWDTYSERYSDYGILLNPAGVWGYITLDPKISYTHRGYTKLSSPEHVLHFNEVPKHSILITERYCSAGRPRRIMSEPHISRGFYCDRHKNKALPRTR